MFDSKKEISRMLNDDAEQQAMRRLVRQAQKTFQKKKSEQERQCCSCSLIPNCYFIN